MLFCLQALRFGQGRNVRQYGRENMQFCCASIPLYFTIIVIKKHFQGIKTFPIQEFYEFYQKRGKNRQFAIGAIWRFVECVEFCRQNQNSSKLPRQMQIYML